MRQYTIVYNYGKRKTVSAIKFVNCQKLQPQNWPFFLLFFLNNFLQNGYFRGFSNLGIMMKKRFKARLH